MSTSAGRITSARSLIDAFNRHDAAAVSRHLAETAVRDRGDGAALEGRNALAARLEDLFVALPDASLIPTFLLAVEPDAVVVEWILQGTHLGEWAWPGREEPIPPTGRFVRITGADLLAFNSEDQIEKDEARIDVAALLDQIGLRSKSFPAEASLRDLARRYTAAWCSRDPARVAALYSPGGSLRVNGDPPATGRGAIAEVAQGFMAAFADLELLMDGLLIQEDRAVFRWTLAGTCTGDGGTSRRVRISGFELWHVGSDGLISESHGHFDTAAYQSQLGGSP